MLQFLTHHIKALLHSFTACRRGNIAIITALVFPVIFVVVGGGIEYGKILNQKGKMQGYADRAAVAAAKELSLSQGDNARIVAVAEAVVNESLRALKQIKNTADFMLSDIIVKVKINSETNTVKVRLTQATLEDFPVNGFELETVSVEAEAQIVGSLNLCVIALEEKKGKAIFLEGNAKLTARGCAVYSNSTKHDAIEAGDNANLKASLICSAGGKIGGKGNYQPIPMTDCPIFEDPLIDRPAPFVGECDYGKNVDEKKKIKTGVKIENKVDSYLKRGEIKVEEKKFSGTEVRDDTKTLEPGVYCGGLIIAGTSKVTLNPGIYIFKNGPFAVQDNSSMHGEDVGLFFTGETAAFSFEKNTIIDLSAPRDGIMAGLLVFEDRDTKWKGIHAILSDNARNLLGTIYLPKSTLLIDADAPIAKDSAYTAVVVRSLNLRAGPHLILNTRYSETEVPVPSNIQGLSSNIRLTK
ncbi:MAG: pilus assembly protein [bacterium]|nr:pilus assembly protein [bacterium]